MQVMKILSLFLILVFIPVSTAVTVIEGDLVNYRNGSISLNDLRLNEVEDLSTYDANKPDLKIEAFSREKRYWTYKSYLSFTKYIPPTGEYRSLEKRISMIRIPANHSNITIKFYRNEENKLEIDQQEINSRLCTYDNECSSYCEGREVDVDCTCGDGVCQEDLNEEELCPSDCSSPEPEQKPGEINNSSDTGREDIVDTDYNIVLLALILVIGAAIILFYTSGKVKIEA